MPHKKIDGSDDPLTLLGHQLAGARRRIENQVTVRGRRGGRETAVSIDHRLILELPGYAGWHVATNPSKMPLAQFSSYARAQIKAAERRRGRAIYCHDLALGELIAAVSYHIAEDRGHPVLLTMIAFRSEAKEDRGIRERTLAGGLVAKHHVHAIAKKIGRGGDIDLDLPNKAQLPLTAQLGFRPAARVKGFKPSGTHLRQPAPSAQGRG